MRQQSRRSSVLRREFSARTHEALWDMNLVIGGANLHHAIHAKDTSAP